MNTGTHFYLATFLLVVLMLEVAISEEATYRYILDVGNPNDYCPKPDYSCSDNKLHYFCAKNVTTGRHRNCRCYKKKKLTPALKRVFVQGHNGIRNKVAYNFKISNMNILYWSDALGQMADKFLEECVLGEDPCKIIGDKQIEVMQNSVYTLGRLFKTWPGRIVRHWYKEIGYEVHTWDEFTRKFKRSAVGNFTNMIWPLSEFIGCGAARMYKGFFVVCFYHPPFDRKTFPVDFKLGDACTACSQQRTVCSKTFSGLCGVDFDTIGASTLKLSSLLLAVALLFSMLPYV